MLHLDYYQYNSITTVHIYYITGIRKKKYCFGRFDVTGKDFNDIEYDAKSLFNSFGYRICLWQSEFRKQFLEYLKQNPDYYFQKNKTYHTTGHHMSSDVDNDDCFYLSEACELGCEVACCCSNLCFRSVYDLGSFNCCAFLSCVGNILFCCIPYCSMFVRDVDRVKKIKRSFNEFSIKKLFRGTWLENEFLYDENAIAIVAEYCRV